MAISAVDSSCLDEPSFQPGVFFVAPDRWRLQLASVGITNEVERTRLLLAMGV